MSEVIRFLEAVAIHKPGAVQFGAMVESIEADARQKQALLACDGEELARLLGGRGTMCCMVLGNDPTAH